MKKYFFITILISFFFCSFSQIPEKANLVIYTADSIQNLELLKECVNSLKKLGYIIDNLDKDFYLVTTEPIEGKNFSQIKLDLYIVKNEVKIYSYVRNFTGIGDIPYSKWFRGEYVTGLKITKYRWKKQLEFVKELHSNVKYGNEKYLIENL